MAGERHLMAPVDPTRSHTHRDRAESFGADPEGYDRARPDYPAPLLDELLAPGPRLVLDVGAGTGQVTRMVAARGVPVIGVEIDDRMAAVARAQGLDVRTGRFETGDEPADGSVDLIVCGQAWHWIDPAAGVARAVRLLGSGGVLAPFWNWAVLDDPARARFDDVYRSEAPQLAERSVLRGGGPATVPEVIDRLRASGSFVSVRVLTYHREVAYSGDRWLELVGTHSDHRALGPSVLRRLQARLGAVIDALGGELSVNYRTDAVVATRPGLDH